MEGLWQTLKAGVGAVTQAVELVQDPNAIPDQLGSLQEQMRQGTLINAWVQKGEPLVAQVQSMAGMSSPSPWTPADPDPYPIAELEALIRQLALIREQLRQP
ncbi:hypothetical protein [Candidatus Cyanaurora vandensis]|uniref:hypothetical protein n=1 Tax=Candidatus Cyanaurora vandensis TaxID=2714958 RepID=UPI00257DFD9D|nr:hypothetical protein [Candidatus Cyanaurora vandensis]